MGADALADIQAVGIRQHDVQDDQVRTLPAAQLDRALAGLRADHGESFFLQVVLDQRIEIRVVFDQHDFLHLQLRVTDLSYKRITITLTPVESLGKSD